MIVIPNSNKMEQVSNMSVESVNDSKYIKPVRMNYVQNGMKKIWDLRLVCFYVILHINEPFFA